MTDWSHQASTIAMIQEKRLLGVRRLVACLPTGAGKTRIMSELADLEVQQGGRVVVYSNRRVIHQQIADAFHRHGLEIGIRAAGRLPKLDLDVQVSSINTEYSRCIKRNTWQIHRASLVLVDEAHSNKGKLAQEVLARHPESFIVGFTATPDDLGGLYEDLYVGARVTELHKAGVLVPCHTWAPEEISMKGIKITAGEFNLAQVEKRLQKCVVIGNIIEHMHRINHDQRPTILFAPSVRTSIFFRDQLRQAGVTAEHIDAKTPQPVRERIFKQNADGDVQVICNCGVLREGFDSPVVSHAILIQPTNRITTYIQICGRIKRSHPGKKFATLQDHVGAWWRHGSCNQDIDWKLEGNSETIQKERYEKLRDGTSTEPVVCPKCGQVRMPIPPWTSTCPCGFQHEKKGRMVREHNGKLVFVEGSPLKETSNSPHTQAMIKAIFSAMYSNQTAGQAVVRASKDLGGVAVLKDNCSIYVPSPDSADWHARARDVRQWHWAWKSVQKKKGGRRHAR